ncbi:hypothetical protein B0H66DRAFT_384251 [Apodospora peruviana]|uniref:Uncharacterized protein n=1 Tax=Apodospora peruviana TaxID=516989 RepID=A0AAE0HUX2_9PEZI|nr:hypothetical protein B0H66DRAFT_384251 [Apodospora peruviana]
MPAASHHPSQSAPRSTYPVAASINSSKSGVYPTKHCASPQPSARQQQHTRNTSSIMSSPQTSHSNRASQPYMIVPDSTTSQIDLATSSWMVATVIEDDDLMFGGKPLSAWYEEDRRRLSTGDEEEERRGRQRERVRIETHHHQYHHHHQQQQQQQQQHTKKNKDLKQ